MVGLADLDPGGPHPCAVPEEVKLETGDIGDDEVVGHIAEDPPEAFEAGPDLIHPVFDGDVEGLDGLRADFSVRIEEVALLEPFDRLLDVIIKEFGIAGCVLETIGHGEAGAKIDHAG